MPDLYVCGFTRVADVLRHAEIHRSPFLDKHCHAHDIVNTLPLQSNKAPQQHLHSEKGSEREIIPPQHLSDICIN